MTKQGLQRCLFLKHDAPSPLPLSVTRSLAVFLRFEILWCWVLAKLFRNAANFKRELLKFDLSAKTSSRAFIPSINNIAIKLAIRQLFHTGNVQDDEDNDRFVVVNGYF